MKKPESNAAAFVLLFFLSLEISMAMGQADADAVLHSSTGTDKNSESGLSSAMGGNIRVIFNRSVTMDLESVLSIRDDQFKGLKIFLRPFSWQLWIMICSLPILLSFGIWVTERTNNEHFRAPVLHQIRTTLWLSFHTVLGHRAIRVNNWTRLIQVAWFFAVLVFTQIYTTKLTWFMENYEPSIKSIDYLTQNTRSVGYQKGSSFVKGLLISMNFVEEQLKTFDSGDDLEVLLSAGSDHGGVDAAFVETSFMEISVNEAGLCGSSFSCLSRATALSLIVDGVFLIVLLSAFLICLAIFIYIARGFFLNLPFRRRLVQLFLMFIPTRNE